MPYIESHRKDFLKQHTVPQTPGDLNYLITIHCLEYLTSKGQCYMVLNDIVGALECAKQEFIRRVVNPYEDSRIEANGDVYT